MEETPKQELSFHQLMKPKLVNFQQKMVSCLLAQGAPEHIRHEWGQKIHVMHENEGAFCYLVVERIIKKWLRYKKQGEHTLYSLDLEDMEKDKEDAIQNMGGMVNLFKSKEDEQKWYECARWVLNEEGKKLVNDYFSMFAKVYITYYSEEGFTIPEAK